MKIVLAVIGIALLVFLLFALYNANSKDQKLVEAKATSDKITDILNELKLNSSYVGKLYQITPIGWSVFSFVQGDLKPNQCIGKDCICICDSVYEFFGIAKDRQEKECSENGACVVVGDLKKFDEISIEKNGGAFISLEIKKDGKWVEVSKI